jgi:hypothetical protein
MCSSARYQMPLPALLYFSVKELVFLFTGSAYANDCAPDEDTYADRDQDRRKVIAQLGQVVENFVNFRKPHKTSSDT